MEAINWEAVQAVSEALGLIVVVGSLIFVGLQIQLNTQAAKIEAVQNIASEWRGALQGISTNKQTADVVFKGMLDIDSLGGSELFQYNGVMHSLFHVMSNAYFQHRTGVFDEETFSGIRNMFRLLCATPGFKAYWVSRKEVFPEAFQQYFEEEIISKTRDTAFTQYKNVAENIEA